MIKLESKNFEFFVLVPNSPIHTGLIYEKNSKPNISSLGPFKRFMPIAMISLLVFAYKSKIAKAYGYDC